MTCVATQYRQRTTALEKQLRDRLAYRPDDVYLIRPLTIPGNLPKLTREANSVEYRI